METPETLSSFSAKPARPGFVASLHHWLSHPAFFYFTRTLLNFGWFKTPIREALDLKVGESVLDVGCGIGVYSSLVGRGHNYFGIDLNPEYIRYANKRWGSESRRFALQDVRELAANGQRFDKGLYVSMLHHFSEEENEKILKAMGQIVRKRIVIVDLLPVEGRPIQNFFVSLDRGEFIRPWEKQVQLIGRILPIEEERRFETRSRSATFSLFKCLPHASEPVL